MISVGHEVDTHVGGAVPDYKYMCNKPKSEFLTGLVEEYSPSCERLGSCLATECLMRKSSMLFLNVDPSPSTSTLCPSDIIHMISVPRPSLFSPLLHFCVPGNKALSVPHMWAIILSPSS